MTTSKYMVSNFIINFFGLTFQTVDVSSDRVDNLNDALFDGSDVPIVDFVFDKVNSVI